MDLPKRGQLLKNRLFPTTFCKIFVYENSRGYTYSEADNSFVRCWKALSKDLNKQSMEFRC